MNINKQQMKSAINLLLTSEKARKSEQVQTEIKTLWILYCLENDFHKEVGGEYYG